MQLWSSNLRAGQPIPERFALGQRDAAGRIRLADNVSPHLAWSELPADTASIAVLCVDVDAPAQPDGVNQDGHQVPIDAPRADFYHWVLVDLPPSETECQEGAYSQGVTARGKTGPNGPGAARQGLNNYTEWFASDPEMRGEYFGYDGPCPPFNDLRIHRYRFSVHALRCERLPTPEESFDGPTAARLIADHELARAEFMATYAICADARSVDP